jgi:uncharacterized damage-inducible protein DinB
VVEAGQRRIIMDTDLRYPIGQFEPNIDLSPAARAERLDTIRQLPTRLTKAVDGLNEQQLDTPYRPGGWTVRQTVHHVADSHINSLIRFKLALTEDAPPTIKPYYEERWAELGDSRLPVQVSLDLVSSVHARWVGLLESLSDEQFTQTFVHPETGEWTLDAALALYAWHSLHHAAHITRLREREGW